MKRSSNKKQRSKQQNRLDDIQTLSSEFTDMCENGFLVTKPELRSTGKKLIKNIRRAMKWCLEFGYVEAHEIEQEPEYLDQLGAPIREMPIEQSSFVSGRKHVTQAKVAKK